MKFLVDYVLSPPGVARPGVEQTVANPTYQYNPDYAVPPGWVLDERLDVQGMSHAEFAGRCGRSPKLISEIISGKAPLDPETALQFEKVLGVDASIWLGIESEYKLHRAAEVLPRTGTARDPE